MEQLHPAAIAAMAAKRPRVPARPPFECIALLLQGGGALGSYQAGVYAALAEAELQPDWVAGISIGAINGALIAGNAPERRVEQLKTFWEQITATPFGLDGWLAPLSQASDTMRDCMNQTSATLALVGGAPGFFTPRVMAPWFVPAGGAGATSYYETAKLRSTLESLIDFDRINSGPVRFTVGAVNVRSGNLVCFDTQTHRIGPEHVMASGALPPGFPAVEIEGEHYCGSAGYGYCAADAVTIPSNTAPTIVTNLNILLLSTGPQSFLAADFLDGGRTWSETSLRAAARF